MCKENITRSQHTENTPHSDGRCYSIFGPNGEWAFIYQSAAPITSIHEKPLDFQVNFVGHYILWKAKYRFEGTPRVV
jgi:hypothetical protein